MTYDPNADSDCWRDQSERRLIEAARDSGHELAIALCEQLEDSEGLDDALADAHAEAIEMQPARYTRAEAKRIMRYLISRDGKWEDDLMDALTTPRADLLAMLGDG